LLRKQMFIVIGALFGTLLFAAPAFAAYPPASGALTVGSSKAAAGGSVTVSGTGCAADASVALTVSSASAGTATADSTGAFSASVKIPSTATGSVDVSASCLDVSGNSVVLTATVTVSGTLPKTGASHTSPTVVIALLALCLGAAFVVATRRRSIARANAGA
jgi:LPXTG-motif cell wall-anchored protein